MQYFAAALDTAKVDSTDHSDHYELSQSGIDPDADYRRRLSVSGIRLLRALIAGIVFVTTGSYACYGQEDLARFDSPEAWQEDAELNDVFFLDAKTGWAVGDQGTILRTLDGGSHWKEISNAPRETANDFGLMDKMRNPTLMSEIDQTRPIRCRFEKIFFIDSNHGWIAGGYSVPYINRSRAFMLRTSDGGQSWHPVRGLVIPRITDLHFTTPSSGWACGDKSSLYPSGIFYTADGGLSWSSETSVAARDWSRAVATGNGFVAIDRRGELAVVGADRAEASTIHDSRSRRVTDVRMIDSKTGWAIGTGGMLLVTADAGRSWNTPTNLQLPPHIDLQNLTPHQQQIASNIRLVRQYDFRALTLTESKLWIAADPGSIISVDRSTGAIRLHPTGITTPLKRIQFNDPSNGWAVGSSGVIVATNNGGESWHAQRIAGSGAALLNIAVYSGSPRVRNNAPAWEAFSRYACEENMRTETLVLWDRDLPTRSNEADRASLTENTAANANNSRVTFTSADPQTDSDPVNLAELRQAVSRLGCSTLVDERFESLADYQQSELLARLVRRIRSIRPRVVVAGSDLNLVAEIRRAVAAAADPGQFTDQLESGELQPWQVDRLAWVDPGGPVSVDLKRLLPRSGCLVEDQIAVCRAIAGLPPTQISATRYSVENLTSAAHGGFAGSGLLDGLDHAGRRLPKRTRDTGIRGTMVMVKHLSQKKNFVTGITQLLGASPNVRRDNVQAMIGPLDFSTGGIWILELASAYAADGNFELAAEMVELFAIRYPEHGLAPSALLWLAEYYSSEEIAAGLFAKTAAAADPRPDNAPAVVTAVPRAVNIDGVTKVTYEVDESLLPAKGARHYGSGISGSDISNTDIKPTTRERGILDRWRNRSQSQADENADEKQEQPPTDTSEKDNDRNNRQQEQPQAPEKEPAPLKRNANGLSAQAVPDLTHSSEPAPQMNPQMSAPTSGPQTPTRFAGARNAAIPAVDPLTLGAEKNERYRQFAHARLARASQYLTMLEQRDPDIGMSAEFEFIEAKIARQLGGWIVAEPMYKKLLGNLFKDQNISLAARRERQAHAQSELNSTSDSFVSMRVHGRPMLDGKPDDAMWQSALSAGRVQRRSFADSGQPQTLNDWIAFAHDGTFLYVFIHCNKLPGQSSENGQSGTTDLESSDRIVLQIDSDRDYNTTADFVVNAVGQKADGWSNWRSVDQSWFVATQSDAATWSAEFAIPMQDLQIPSMQQSGTSAEVRSWAVRMARLDSRGTDVWTGQSEKQGSGSQAQILTSGRRRTKDFEMLEFTREVIVSGHSRQP